MTRHHFRTNRRHIDNPAKLFCIIKESLPQGCKNAYKAAYWDSTLSDQERVIESHTTLYDGAYVITVRPGYIFGSNGSDTEVCINITEIRDKVSTVRRVSND